MSRVQLTIISHSQICHGKFFKFTGMLSILESNLFQYILSVSKWPPQAVFKMYTEQTSIAVEVVCFKPFLKIIISY